MDTYENGCDMRKWSELSDDERTGWEALAAELVIRSREICAMNECTEEDHNCESYAYVAADGSLLDVCPSDYFQGWGSEDEEAHGGCAAVSLPLDDGGAELYDTVQEDAFSG